MENQENIKVKALDEDGFNNPPIVIFNIKTEEEDYPELVTEDDILTNYLPSDHALENSENNSDIKRTFKCIHCNEQFPGLKHLQVHEAVHDPRMICPVCGKDFKIKKVFVQHIKMHLEYPIGCQLCPEVFFDKKSYHLHRYSHKKTVTYNCEYCFKEWSNKKDLKLHIRVHTNERPYVCGECGKAFKQKGALNTHISALHANNKIVKKERFRCDICNGLYSSVSSLNKHIRRIHEAGKIFACNKCDETFLNFSKMKEHKLENHPNVTPIRTCSICNQKFSCRNKFRKHQQIHKKSGQNLIEAYAPIDCHLCGEKVLGIRQFYKHQQVHLLMTDQEVRACGVVRRFNCKVCDKRFTRKSNLFVHMDVHLEKKFKCEAHCSKKFTYLGIKLHTEWYSREFTCSECNEIFVGRKSFKEHLEVHPGALKYTCKICGVTLKASTFVQHSQMMHSIKCSVCFRKFVSLADFKKHNRINHRLNSENLPPGEEHVETKFPSDVKYKYVCKICNHQSPTLDNFKDHMKLHEKHYQCISCKKNFLHFRNLMFHLKHNICRRNLEDSGNHLKCILCKNEYSDMKTLMTHMRRHSAILTCIFCHSKFKQKDLQGHIRRAHPENFRFSCEKCGTSFCTSNELVRHTLYCYKMLSVENELDKMSWNSETNMEGARR